MSLAEDLWYSREEHPNRLFYKNRPVEGDYFRPSIELTIGTITQCAWFFCYNLEKRINTKIPTSSIDFSKSRAQVGSISSYRIDFNMPLEELKTTLVALYYLEGFDD